MSKGKFTFDHDQPWVSPGSTRREAGRRPKSRAQVSPQNDEDSRDDPMVAAASLLHSLSQVDCRTQDDVFEFTESAPLPTDDLPLSDSLSPPVLQDSSRPRIHNRNAQFSLEYQIRSPQIDILSPATSDPSASVQQVSSTSPLTNDLSLPEDPNLPFISPIYCHNDSPYSNRDRESLGVEDCRDSHSGLSIQEACLVRCFADHLAQNVGWPV